MYQAVIHFRLKGGFIMGKYFLYAVIALIIAFTANFFEIVHIPWLDLPVDDANTLVNQGRDNTKAVIKEIDRND